MVYQGVQLITIRWLLLQMRNNAQHGCKNFEGEAIKTIIHKHRLSELINVVDSFSASVDGMVGGCLQSD